jgi:hypothetical protein
VTRLYIDGAVNTAMKGQPEAANHRGVRREPGAKPVVRIVVRNDGNAVTPTNVRVRFRLEKKGLGTFANGANEHRARSKNVRFRAPFVPSQVQDATSCCEILMNQSKSSEKTPSIWCFGAAENFAFLW